MNWTNGRVAVTVMAAALLSALAFAGGASAATFTPTTFLDQGDVERSHCPANAVETDPENDCSLREAVEAANESPEADEVVLAAGRYELNSDPSESADPVEIRELTSDETDSGKLLIRGAGARATTVDANATTEDESRAFAFDSESVAELRDLAVTGGLVTGFSNGGAIKVRDGGDADVTMTRVWLHGNHAGGDGGAISNRGKLTLVQSLLSANTADGSGGAIENDDELTLINTTVSGNEAQGDQFAKLPPTEALSEQFDDDEGNGGGIDNDGDDRDDEIVSQLAGEPIPEEAPFLRAENSTIAFNEAAGDGGGVSTAIPERRLTLQGDTGGPIARFHNSIVSDNKSADGDSSCSGNQPADSGAWTSSEGHNLEDGTSCLFTAPGDLNKASKIGPLADNGGGTDTHALAADSAAVNAAETAGCPDVDQRGTARPQEGGCDIGAYERVPDPKQAEPEPEPQQLPQQQNPEAERGPRCLDPLPPITQLTRDNVRVTSKTVTLKGTSRDQGDPCASGVQRVEVSLARVSGTDLNCRFMRRANRFLLSPFMNCRESIRFVAKGTNQWTFRFRVRLPAGQYRVQARGYDEERNKETPKKRRNIVPFTVE